MDLYKIARETFRLLKFGAFLFHLFVVSDITVLNSQQRVYEKAGFLLIYEGDRDVTVIHDGNGISGQNSNP